MVSDLDAMAVITLADFQKADLRAAKIISAERVEGSEKLLKLRVDIGGGGSGETRQIVSGIAKAYTPESLVGKSVVIIANLEPRMLMGLESRGMLLAAHDADGMPVVIMPAADIPPGAKIL